MYSTNLGSPYIDVVDPFHNTIVSPFIISRAPKADKGRPQGNVPWVPSSLCQCKIAKSRIFPLVLPENEAQSKHFTTNESGQDETSLEKQQEDFKKDAQLHDKDENLGSKQQDYSLKDQVNELSDEETEDQHFFIKKQMNTLEIVKDLEELTSNVFIKSRLDLLCLCSQEKTSKERKICFHEKIKKSQNSDEKKINEIVQELLSKVTLFEYVLKALDLMINSLASLRKHIRKELAYFCPSLVNLGNNQNRNYYKIVADVINGIENSSMSQPEKTISEFAEAILYQYSKLEPCQTLNMEVLMKVITQVFFLKIQWMDPKCAFESQNFKEWLLTKNLNLVEKKEKNFINPQNYNVFDDLLRTTTGTLQNNLQMKSQESLKGWLTFRFKESMLNSLSDEYWKIDFDQKGKIEGLSEKQMDVIFQTLQVNPPSKWVHNKNQVNTKLCDQARGILTKTLKQSQQLTMFFSKAEVQMLNIYNMKATSDHEDFKTVNDEHLSHGQVEGLLRVTIDKAPDDRFLDPKESEDDLNSQLKKLSVVRKEIEQFCSSETLLAQQNQGNEQPIITFDGHHKEAQEICQYSNVKAYLQEAREKAQSQEEAEKLLKVIRMVESYFRKLQEIKALSRVRAASAVVLQLNLLATKENLVKNGIDNEKTWKQSMELQDNFAQPLNVQEKQTLVEYARQANNFSFRFLQVVKDAIKNNLSQQLQLNCMYHQETIFTKNLLQTHIFMTLPLIHLQLQKLQISFDQIGLQEKRMKQYVSDFGQMPNENTSSKVLKELDFRNLSKNNKLQTIYVNHDTDFSMVEYNLNTLSQKISDQNWQQELILLGKELDQQIHTKSLQYFGVEKEEGPQTLDIMNDIFEDEHIASQQRAYWAEKNSQRRQTALGCQIQQLSQADHIPRLFMNQQLVLQNQERVKLGTQAAWSIMTDVLNIISDKFTQPHWQPYQLQWEEFNYPLDREQNELTLKENGYNWLIDEETQNKLLQQSRDTSLNQVEPSLTKAMNSLIKNWQKNQIIKVAPPTIPQLVWPIKLQEGEECQEFSLLTKDFENNDLGFDNAAIQPLDLYEKHPTHFGKITFRITRLGIPLDEKTQGIFGFSWQNTNYQFKYLPEPYSSRILEGMVLDTAGILSDRESQGSVIAMGQNGEIIFAGKDGGLINQIMNKVFSKLRSMGFDEDDFTLEQAQEETLFQGMRISRQNIAFEEQTQLAVLKLIEGGHIEENSQQEFHSFYSQWMPRSIADQLESLRELEGSRNDQMKSVTELWQQFPQAKISWERQDQLKSIYQVDLNIRMAQTEAEGMDQNSQAQSEDYYWSDYEEHSQQECNAQEDNKRVTFKDPTPHDDEETEGDEDVNYRKLEKQMQEEEYDIETMTYEEIMELQNKQIREQKALFPNEDSSDYDQEYDQETESEGEEFDEEGEEEQEDELEDRAEVSEEETEQITPHEDQEICQIEIEQKQPSKDAHSEKQPTQPKSIPWQDFFRGTEELQKARQQYGVYQQSSTPQTSQQDQKPITIEQCDQLEQKKLLQQIQQSYQLQQLEPVEKFDQINQIISTVTINNNKFEKINQSNLGFASNNNRPQYLQTEAEKLQPSQKTKTGETWKQLGQENQTVPSFKFTQREQTNSQEVRLHQKDNLNMSTQFNHQKIEDCVAKPMEPKAKETRPTTNPFNRSSGFLNIFEAVNQKIKTTKDETRKSNGQEPQNARDFLNDDQSEKKVKDQGFRFTINQNRKQNYVEASQEGKMQIELEKPSQEEQLATSMCEVDISPRHNFNSHDESETSGFQSAQGQSADQAHHERSEMKYSEAKSVTAFDTENLDKQPQEQNSYSVFKAMLSKLM